MNVGHYIVTRTITDQARRLIVETGGTIEVIHEHPHLELVTLHQPFYHGVHNLNEHYAYGLNEKTGEGIWYSAHDPVYRTVYGGWSYAEHQEEIEAGVWSAIRDVELYEPAKTVDQGSPNQVRLLRPQTPDYTV